MKTILNILLVIFFFAMMAVAFTACETIEIEKLVFDTVYVDRPVRSLVVTQTTVVDTVYRELLRVDTVEVTVVVHDTIINEVLKHDTVFQVRTDSIFVERVVEKVVNHYDTIIQVVTVNHTDTVYIDKIVQIHDTLTVIEYDQRVIYQSVEFMFPGRSTFYVADEFKPYYDDYNKAAGDRNVLLNGGNVIITRVAHDNLPAEGWISNFYYVAGDQAIIEVSDQLPIEQARAAIYREMSRWQLKKKYSLDVNKIMSNFFRTSPEPTTSEINILFN